MHISQKYADEQARAITYFLAYGPMQTDNDYVAAIDYVYTNLTLQSYKVAVVNLTMANYAPVGCQWHPSAYVHNQMALQAQGQMWRVMNWVGTPTTPPLTTRNRPCALTSFRTPFPPTISPHTLPPPPAPKWQTCPNCW